MFEVVLAVVRPQAAVVEAQDVVHPVGHARDAGRPPVGGRAPVVGPVRGAPPDGVGRQDLGPRVVVAALLACSVLWTIRQTRRIRLRVA